jgi:4-amino-4-deoxy-L-arabinose transferase-like glycosyltransferase
VIDSPNNPRLRLCLLILAAGALYLLANGRVALWDRDEPRYAMASRWMLASGDWVVPRMGWGLNPETPRTAKPPLIYWAQATAMKLFGPTVMAARLPSSVAMILTLILLACVLGKYFPQHAFWTLLIFATSVLTIVAAKMCVIDSILLLWITICQICLYAMWRGKFFRGIVLLFGIALGLAGLAKGPVAWGVLATTLIVLQLLRWSLKSGEQPRRIPWLRFVAIAMIAIAIGLPWLILVQQRSPGFLGRIIGHDLIQRMHEPLEGHKGPPGFYLLTIFGTFYPWSLFLPLLIANAWRHRDELAIRFALAAVIGPWIMFECISTKMVHYVLPIFPPLAFLLADALVRCLREQKNDLNKPIAKWGIAIWAMMTTAIATALILPDKWFIETPLWPGIAMVIAGLVYAIAVLSLFWKEKIRCALMAMGLGFAGFAALLFAYYLPWASFLRISPNVARILNANHARDAGMVGYEEQSLAFYDAGRIDSLPAQGLHQDFRAWPPFIVVSADIYNRLSPATQSHLLIIGRTIGINYSKSIKPIEVFIAQKTPMYGSLPYSSESRMDSIFDKP